MIGMTSCIDRNHYRCQNIPLHSSCYNSQGTWLFVVFASSLLHLSDYTTPEDDSGDGIEEEISYHTKVYNASYATTGSEDAEVGQQ